MADGQNGTGLLARAAKLFAGMGFGADGADATARTRLSKTDFGVLKVALMIAALDGEVLPEELAAFDRLARKCRGWSEDSAAAALDEALHSAGYLLLQHARLTEDRLLEVFAAEAEEALPVGFAYGSPLDVRRAFAMWTAMGLSDGSYSAVERRGIAALQKMFGEIQRERFAAEINLWSSLASAYRTGPCGGGAGAAVAQSLKLLPDGFLDRAERLLTDLAGAADEAAAERELRELILNG